jgi:nucleotide-binding universal stress UspA family protein
MRRILVPTDFSDASRPAIHYALALTAAVEGDLLLLHVVEGDPLPRYVVGDMPEMFPSWMDFSGQRFQGTRSPTSIHHDRCEEARWKLASLLPSSCPERFRPLVTVGRAAEEIIRVARDEPGGFDPARHSGPTPLAPCPVANGADPSSAPDAHTGDDTVHRWPLSPPNPAHACGRAVRRRAAALANCR